MDIIKDPNEVLADLFAKVRDLSVAADAFMTDQTYLHYIPIDAVRPFDLLREVVMVFMEDLAMEGVIIHDTDAVLANGLTIEAFLEVMTYVHPPSLFRFIKTDATLRDAITGLADVTERVSDFLDAYVLLLGGNDAPYYPYLQRHVDVLMDDVGFSCTSEYIDRIVEMCKTCVTDGANLDADVDYISALHAVFTSYITQVDASAHSDAEKQTLRTWGTSFANILGSEIARDAYRNTLWASLSPPVFNDLPIIRVPQASPAYWVKKLNAVGRIDPIIRAGVWFMINTGAYANIKGVDAVRGELAP